MPSAAPPFLIIGNPGNRRVTLFQEALVRAGLPPAHVVAWETVARAPDVLLELPDTERIVRIDAAGEDAAVERLFLQRGYADALGAGCDTVTPEALAALPYEHGRVLCPRQHHLGFLRVLEDLSARFALRPHWRVLSAPDAIADLFDKRTTSRRYAGLGIPVPPYLDMAPGTAPEALRHALREAGFREAFVKLSCGSSASCLAVYRPGRTDGAVGSLLTSLHRGATGWFNSLKVRRVTDARDVDAVLSFLLREGSQVEESRPKARLGGDMFDCRVLAVRGEPAFTVVRQSRLPITNLHLGGYRGDLEAFHAAVPPRELEAAMESCRAVARAHECLHVGIDLMFEDFFHGHRVLEANAFGDLLPGLTRDGLSVYDWEIREALR
ncbi:STM4014 family protein [Corallococcus carmarthensis]|uniref:STM4014 family protein n=1 Tax=Corallococcus carmarthensis TaxID=2316728 RepID=UPI00148C426C|nr:STM4014 family protein [Corallococcus carmarthensis]NOK17874.1 STM4014 family protein [Corallococcus carmarthensis]